jgi:hypothetical protein
MLAHKQHSITMSAIICTFPDVKYSNDSRTESSSANAPSTIIRNTGFREDPGRSISANTAGMPGSFTLSVCSLLAMVDVYAKLPVVASRRLSFI